MKFKKLVKKILDESSEVFADKVVCKVDGSIEVKRGYFYAHGYSAEKWAEKVKTELENAGLKVSVSNRDDWRTWPKDSYFVAIVKET